MSFCANGGTDLLNSPHGCSFLQNTFVAALKNKQNKVNESVYLRKRVPLEDNKLRKPLIDRCVCPLWFSCGCSCGFQCSTHEHIWLRTISRLQQKHAADPTPDIQNVQSSYLQSILKLKFLSEDFVSMS